MPADSISTVTRYDDTPNIPGPWIKTYAVNPKNGAINTIRGLTTMSPTETADELDLREQGSLLVDSMRLAVLASFSMTMHLTDIVQLLMINNITNLASNYINVAAAFPLHVIRRSYDPDATAIDMMQEPVPTKTRASEFYRKCRYMSHTKSNSESGATDITIAGKAKEIRTIDGKAFFDQNPGLTNLPVTVGTPPAWIATVLGTAPDSYYQTKHASSTVPLCASYRVAIDTASMPTDITEKQGTFGVTGNPSWDFAPYDAPGNTDSKGTFAFYGIPAADFVGVGYGVPSDLSLGI